MRLDQYLVEEGFVDSRTKAQVLIKARKVSVNGRPVTKPAFNVTDEKVEAADEMIYVSRAAHKLKGFLPSLPFVLKELDAIDIGASTGGFTQVLLEEGVKGVTCVDVGRGQLHQKLLDDRRVISFEGMDIRDFTRQKRYDLVTSDVSFISLHHILESVDALSKKWIILLFKPQFEVGKEVKRDSNGVVIDEKAIESAKKRFEEATSAMGWKLVHHEPSKLSGKEGNLEECYCFEKC
ncbi:TlyA family RNA methyltransferase [bacterium]|jgi:23S rRNA (cytidine1920-2'-O)/16S rRNA (cytidine1409-2'-O)-methyltransferase|nr:TlyA family RNA methyltransferase [bacterium]